MGKHGACWDRDGALIDSTTRYVDDVRCRFVVRHFAGDYTLTLDDVGELIGLSRERVRQVEETALRKLRMGLELLDVLAHDADATERSLQWLAGKGPTEFADELAVAKRRRAAKEAA